MHLDKLCNSRSVEEIADRKQLHGRDVQVNRIRLTFLRELAVRHTDSEFNPAAQLHTSPKMVRETEKTAAK